MNYFGCRTILGIAVFVAMVSSSTVHALCVAGDYNYMQAEFQQQQMELQHQIQQQREVLRQNQQQREMRRQIQQQREMQRQMQEMRAKQERMRREQQRMEREMRYYENQNQGMYQTPYVY